VTSHRRAYDLSRVEQGDLVTIGFPHGISFNAIVTAEPSDVSVECIDRDGLEMIVPASLVLSHTERGQWQASRERRAA